MNAMTERVETITTTSGILLAADVGEIVTSDWFLPGYWQAQDKIVGQSYGRSTAYFFQHNDRRYVLRHYYRGGLIQRLSRDHYLYLGVKRSRAYRELQLLQYMRRENLPCPRPVAAQISRVGGMYTADIIMELIPDAKDAYTLLGEKKLTLDMWRKIGSCIRQFHLSGIDHADLNIHNIMLDQSNTVWLIDFDRGCLRAPGRMEQRWQQSNISRLLQSLRKEKRKNAQFAWEEPTDWPALLEGYQVESQTNK